MPTMFGCCRPAALDASRRKRSTNSLVLGEVAVQQLERDMAAELLVLGQVDVGHAAGAEPLEDAVAAVDQRVALDARALPLPE